LQTHFADPLAHYVQASTTDRHRGRLEVRQIKVSTELTAYLSAQWRHLQQVAELTRTVTCQGKTALACARAMPRKSWPPSAIWLSPSFTASPSSQIAASRRYFASHPEQALAFLVHQWGQH
jgi:hypothetical protein